MPNSEPKISAIILAAGNSSRLQGKPKQLLEFHDQTLLRRAAETAAAADFRSTVVVLGANAETLWKEIEDLPVKIVINENWATGMSSSIKIGLSEFIKSEFINKEYLDAVVIMLCDQPLVTTKTLLDLCDVFARTKKPIAACAYQKTVGVPALFSREVFAELMDLRESEGAKKIIEKYAGKIALIAAPEAASDVDTWEDYEKLQQLSFSA